MPWNDTKQQWERFVGFLAPRPGEKILDVGAGKGEIAARVLEASGGAQVFAVDPNKKRVASMKRDFPAVSSSVASAERLPYPDSDFDKVYTTMALHHYADLDMALGEIERVLKHGGTFLILEVEPGSGLGRVFRFFGRLMGERLNIMSRERLVAKLALRKGFRVSGSEGLGPTYLVRLTRA